MNLKQLYQGIEDALYKGFLARVDHKTACPHCGGDVPVDEEWWAKFIQEAHLYLFEFTKRFKEKNQKFQTAKRRAWWDSVRKIREERVAKIMSLRLPHEPEGLYVEPAPEVLCECGAFKAESHSECLECSEKRYEELNRGN